jgi:hypothetical protein
MYHPAITPTVRGRSSRFITQTSMVAMIAGTDKAHQNHSGVNCLGVRM